MGAYQMPFKTITIDPKISFADKRYFAVTVDSTGKGVLPAAKKPIVGAIQEPNGIGEPANTIVEGVTYASLGGAVAAGDPIEVNGDGQFVTLTDGHLVGICLVGGSAKGDIGSVLLK